jgi:hypothetical protein
VVCGATDVVAGVGAVVWVVDVVTGFGLWTAAFL